MERIIIRRGRFRTYELLRRTFGKDPNIEIIWDRRRSQTDARADYLFTNGTRRAGSGSNDKPKDPQVQ